LLVNSENDFDEINVYKKMNNFVDKIFIIFIIIDLIYI